ncbi:MAG: patatin-like phospholipase family protein, partial [Mariniphaga sp.]|nr:patatin-like phospholipase family protein [Mariniphaga sp.]
VESQDWERLLSDNVDRKYYSRNEQILKQRYLLSFSFSDVKSIGLPQGIIKGQNILNLFCGLSGNLNSDTDFSQLPISYASVAADLETGNEVVINSGFFPTALFASMAIPGAFLPMNRNGLLLADGGIVNNFPTDVAKRMGADIIIGVDIRGNLKPKEELTSVDGIFNQMIGFLGQGKDSVNNSLCNIIIRPDITGYSVGNFSREAVDTLILRGGKATLSQQEQIRELKRKFNLTQREYSRQYVVNDKWKITDISFTGNSNLDKTFLKNKLNLELPGNYSREQIQNAIDGLYGYGGFDLVYYYLTDNNNGKTLNLNITPRKVFSQRIGFKVNTNDAAALLFNATRKNYEKPIGYLSLNAELSANPGVSFVAETNKRNLPTLGLELRSKYQQYKIYENGDKLSSADLFYSALDIYLYKTFFNQLSFGLGVQEEYFSGDVFTKNTNSLVLSSKTNQFLSNAYTYIIFDNMDNFYFPHKGTRLDAEFSVYSDLSGNSSLSSALLFKMKNAIPLSSNTTFLFDVYSRSMFNNNYPRIKTTVIGGEPYSQYFNYHLPFIGLPPVTLADRYTNIGLAGIRFHVAKNQYVSLVYNLIVQGNNYNELNNFLITNGGGVRYSVDSRLGPVEIGIGYAGRYDKPTFSANLGLWY